MPAPGPRRQPLEAAIYGQIARTGMAAASPARLHMCSPHSAVPTTSHFRFRRWSLTAPENTLVTSEAAPQTVERLRLAG